MIPKEKPSCLDTIIGYDAACANAGTKLFIQMMPGMNVKFGANIADSDKLTAENVYKNSISFAVENIKSQLYGVLRPYLALSVMENACLCMPPTNDADITWTTSATRDLGCQVVINANSRLADVYIRSLRILSQNTGTFILRVKEDDNTLTSYNVDLVANQYAVIQLDYKVSTNRVKLYFDAGSGVTLGTYKCAQSTASGGCGCGGGSAAINNTVYKQNSRAVLYGYDSNTPNTYQDTMIYGIQPCIEISCDSEKLLCIYRERLALPILWLACSLVLQESLVSTRINVSTIVNQEQREKNAADWAKLAMLKVEEIGLEIADFIAKTPTDDCFVCKTGLRNAFAIG